MKKYKLNKELERLRRARYRKKRTDFIDKLFGVVCVVCGNTKGRMPLHRKDGKPHQKFQFYRTESLIQYLSENVNEFVRLCYRCHKTVHWCMEFLNMTWDEIERLRNLNGQITNLVS